MTLLGLFGIFAGLLAAPLAWRHRTPARTLVFLAAYSLHILTTFAYYRVATTSAADANLYYYDPYGMFENGIGSSTQFVLYIVQYIKSVVGGSFLDYFLLFQAMGMFGLAMLMRTIESIHDELGVKISVAAYGLLFLPSMHYWSSAVGKDAPFFCACVLLVWASMDIRKRYIIFSTAATITLFIRPHVAALALAALAFSLMFDRSTRFVVRVGLLICSLLGMAYAVASMVSTFGLEGSSADILSSRMSARDQTLQGESAGNTAVDAVFPLRVVSLLFRPFFFDARDALSYLASLENFIIAVMILSLALRPRLMISLLKNVPYARFAAAFGAALIILLGFEYYNVGLGLRQKWTMIMPSILVLFITMRSLVASKKLTEGSLPPEQVLLQTGGAPIRRVQPGGYVQPRGMSSSRNIS